ncbi:MAG: MurR/RpiR family transcriptional regulator, partial [Oscillospiraceae bacterium]|nr:MurR/RpiR family transcriptional regulator [Oscillospiraceae bacterium]
MSNAVLDQILKVKDVLPKKQRILCNYLALNYEQIGVMTVAELADNAGVGNTTVMRLVQTLGFDSFTTFKRALVNASLVKNTSSYHSLKQGFAQGAQEEPGATLHRVASDGV